MRVSTVVGVAGASGYVGAELLRLLDQHPEIELGPITAHAHVGQRIGQVHPNLSGLADRVLLPTQSDVIREADLVFVSLPNGLAAPLVRTLPADQLVVDLGADHRLVDPEVHQRFYGGERLGPWTYGVPEIPNQRKKIGVSRRVCTSGCYAVAIIVALFPLIREGVVRSDDIVVTAASGTTGAGRSARAELLASEIIGNVSAYEVGRHRHVPEIVQMTGASNISFIPMLVPMSRGIFAVITARACSDSTTAEHVHKVLLDAYDTEPFVHICDGASWPRTAATVGSNCVQLQATVDTGSGRVIICSAIDNLGKGAAGQAVQCANLMLGLPETAGLTVNGATP